MRVLPVVLDQYFLLASKLMNLDVHCTVLAYAHAFCLQYLLFSVAATEEVQSPVIQNWRAYLTLTILSGLRFVGKRGIQLLLCVFAPELEPPIIGNTFRFPMVRESLVCPEDAKLGQVKDLYVGQWMAIVEIQGSDKLLWGNVIIGRQNISQCEDDRSKRGGSLQSTKGSDGGREGRSVTLRAGR
jgi:hypothetical protein